MTIEVPEDIITAARESILGHGVPSDILDDLQEDVAMAIVAERQRCSGFELIGYTDEENISQANADADLGCFHAKQSGQYSIPVYVLRQARMPGTKVE